MSLDLLTAPATEPLDLPTVKLWARIDSDAFDPILPMMISAARQNAEHELGCKLINQTWRLSLTDWPASIERIPLFPVSDLVVTYWNGTVWATLSPLAYGFVRNGFGVSVTTRLGGSFAALSPVVGPRVRFDFVAGYGVDATFVPQAIRQWMAAHIALWIRSPESATERYAVVANPFLSGLIDPFRTYL